MLLLGPLGAINLALQSTHVLSSRLAFGNKGSFKLSSDFLLPFLFFPGLVEPSLEFTFRRRS
jgi:hypothetical protein